MRIKEWMERNFSKVPFYDRVLWKNYLSIIAVISSIVTLVSFFITAQQCGIPVIYIGIMFTAVLIIIFLYEWWKANHQNCVRLRINNTKVVVREGDIFELLDKSPENREGEISVIGVNDYYDIIVDNRIIAKSSLHGQYIKKMDQLKKLKELDTMIETDVILNKDNNYEAVPNRLKGRKTRYRIGSVFEFESYILTAFTKFTDNNKAYLSAEDYTKFWMRFWDNIDEIYAGRTINIPLMGAGITRFRNGKPSKQELLEIMLWSLKISGFHNTYGNRKINFIIYKADMEDINFYHIQHNSSFK